MINMVARLSKSLPLIIALIVIALIIYAIVSYMRTPARAKEVLIKVFIVLCSVLVGFFALVSIYAVIDGNVPVLELAASFAIIGAIGLIITLICRYFFKKHNPHYRQKANVKAEVDPGSESITSRTLFWQIYDILGHFKPKK